MNQVKVICADLAENTRREILNKYPPAHSLVYASHVTAAYKKLNGVNIKGLHTAVVMGQVITDRIHSLVLRVNGDDYRPDGKPWHLTVSLASGVEPKEGGNFHLDQMIESVDHRFPVLFLRRNAQHDVPEIWASQEESSYA